MTSGLLVARPSEFVPAKNSTVATVPSTSHAAASRRMLAGATNTASAVGLWNTTDGG